MKRKLTLWAMIVSLLLTMLPTAAFAAGRADAIRYAETVLGEA